MHGKFNKSETQLNTNNSFPKTKQHCFYKQNEHAHIFNHSSLIQTTTVFPTAHHPSFDCLKTTYVYNEFNQLNSQSHGWQRILEDLSAQQSAGTRAMARSFLSSLLRSRSSESTRPLLCVKSPRSLFISTTTTCPCMKHSSQLLSFAMFRRRPSECLMVTREMSKKNTQHKMKLFVPIILNERRTN